MNNHLTAVVFYFHPFGVIFKRLAHSWAKEAASREEQRGDGKQDSFHVDSSGLDFGRAQKNAAHPRKFRVSGRLFWAGN